MLFTLLASLIITQLFNPFFIDFEKQVALKQALQGSHQHQVAPQRININNLGPKITSRSSIVIDQGSRVILWSNKLHNRFPIASISKLMTALVFLDTNPNLSTKFTLSKEDITNGGVTHIQEGETITLKDLLFSALIASDNNAAQGMVRASNLGYDEFIKKMNTKAQDLGMLNTNFVEPTGLQFANISSAQDVSLLLEAALANDLTADIIKRSDYEFFSISGKKYKLNNTNKLLDSYLYILGGKTGFNNEARFNLTVAIQGEQGQTLLITVLGSNSPNNRFQDVKALAQWALDNYEW